MQADLQDQLASLEVMYEQLKDEEIRRAYEAQVAAQRAAREAAARSAAAAAATGAGAAEAAGTWRRCGGSVGSCAGRRCAGRRCAVR
ncbi:MAG: hypothetical protein R2713_01340 [Ilumatobacteraceae bacterium]